MLKLSISILTIGILTAVVLSATGLIVEHPNNVLALGIPANWNIAPSLTAEQKGPTNHVPNNKVPTVAPNKRVETSEMKNVSSLKATHDVEVSERISDKDQKSIGKRETIDSHIVAPKNVVLVLVAKSEGKGGEDLKSISRLDVEGYLQTCQNNSSEPTHLSLDDVLVSESQGKNCECEHLLRMNVGAFLMWARYERGMVTGTVLSSNFTLPSSLRHRRMLQYTKEFEESRRTSEIPKISPETQNMWHAIGFGTPKDFIIPPANLSHVKKETRRSDSMWDMIDEFSKLRLAFFRKLLQTLTRNIVEPYGAFGSRKPYPLESNLTELTSNTIRELKSVPNENGYAMVVAAPENELIDTIELLRRETSEEDTLLVVMEVCSGNGNRVAFFAQGPGSQTLTEATMVWELPTIIRNTIISGCQVTGCPTRRHSIPNRIFEIEVHHEPLV